MFSEIHAMGEAEQLDKVLMVAIEESIVPVLDFCKEQVYPLYESACAETWSTNPSTNHKKINDFFKNYKV